MIVPTLCVGMQPGTLRVPSEAERRASVEAFPRRAWERSSVARHFNQRHALLTELLLRRNHPKPDIDLVRDNTTGPFTLTDFEVAALER